MQKDNEILIDIEREELLQLKDLSLEIERLTGNRPTRSTCERWRTTGCNGVRLQTIKIGGRRFTSKKQLAIFINANSPKHVENRNVK